MALHIDADTGRCIGAGQCVMTAPDLFDQDDGGTVIVLEADPPEAMRELVREAAYLCPASAITAGDS